MFVSLFNAKVKISDTGIGIPKRDIKNIGKKFYRSNQYIAPNGKGTSLVRPGGSGLGLFVTFGLVREHGGKVEIESQFGKGSTFSFTIPLLKGEMRDEPLDKKGLFSGDMFEKYGLKKSKE